MNFQLMNYKVLCWFMSVNLTNRRKRSKLWRPQQKITWRQEEIEDEVEVEAEAEETMIMEINTNTNVKTTDFKEEDKVATTQLHINQGQ